LIPSIIANLGWCGWFKVIEVVLAVIVSVSVEKSLWNNVKVENNLWE